jgi:hypothetical protein
LPVEVRVGPSVLTINQGSTFMVTDLYGEIAAESKHGVFAGDMRVLSSCAISANSEPWVRLTSTAIDYNAARIFLTNATIAAEEGDFPAGTRTLAISRMLGGGIHKELGVTHHGLAPVRFNLEVALRSDFADLFDQMVLTVTEPQPIEHQCDGGRPHADLLPIGRLLLVQPLGDGELATHLRDNPEMLQVLHAIRRRHATGSFHPVDTASSTTGVHPSNIPFAAQSKLRNVGTSFVSRDFSPRRPPHGGSTRRRKSRRSRTVLFGADLNTISSP